MMLSFFRLIILYHILVIVHNEKYFSGRLILITFIKGTSAANHFCPATD